VRVHHYHFDEESKKHIRVLGVSFGMWRGMGVLHMVVSRPRNLTYYSWLYGDGRFEIDFVPDLTAYWDFIKEGKLPHGFAEAMYCVVLVPETAEERAFLEDVDTIFARLSGDITLLLVPKRLSDEMYGCLEGGGRRARGDTARRA